MSRPAGGRAGQLGGGGCRSTDPIVFGYPLVYEVHARALRWSGRRQHRSALLLPVMSESSDKYRRAITRFSDVVDSVPSDKWSSPSPCEGWTAAHVVGHVIGGTQMISVAQ